MPTFLSLPTELRLAIYAFYLSEHQRVSGIRQPTNAHFALLYTCKLISYEAGELAGFRSYVSLLHEGQISAFVRGTSDVSASKITFADVANDMRMVRSESLSHPVPVSQLYLALHKLTSLRKLRVFECTRNRPLSSFVSGAQFSIQLEQSMFPYPGVAPHLGSYELYLKPSGLSTIHVFQVISPDSMHSLRLSGGCTLPRDLSLPVLTDLRINGVTGHYLDQHLEEHFGQSPLESFSHKQGGKFGHELRNSNFSSLVFGGGSGLRRLVLLECSRLSTATLTSCLQHLSSLEYFALSYITVHELHSDFISVLPPSLSVLKLRITNEKHSTPLIEEEHKLCEVLEEAILKRHPPLHEVSLHFREEVIREKERMSRWMAIARTSFALKIDYWEHEETF